MMRTEPSLDEPDGLDYSLLAEADPNCPVCGQAGEIMGEPIGGQVGVRLQCRNPLCPGNDPDEGPQTWEVWEDV